MQISLLNGVGMVASRARTLRPGYEYNGYFPTPSYTNPVLSHSAENEDTLEHYIPEVVNRYKGDTERISLLLKQRTLEETCKAIWHFVYNHIQYRLDEPHEEQIRRPARTWADRQSGVDCDCYTVFISSILLNLGIRHSIRMTAYNKNRGFQHVYIVVPTSPKSDLSKRSEYVVLDCVMDAYNTEKPFYRKKEKMMGATGALNGFPVRMLDGTGFNSRSNLVYDSVYYSPSMGTWALKGIDGGYYIRGDKRLRYVEPLSIDGLNGGFFKKMIKSAVKLATPLAAGAMNAFIPGSGTALTALTSGLTSGGAKKAGQATITQVQNAASNALQPSAASGEGNQALENKIRTANNNTVRSVDTAKQGIEKAIQANNRATVTSLDNVDKASKDRLDKFAAQVNTILAKVNANAATAVDVTQAIQAVTSKSVAITAGTQAITQEQTAILTEETGKNENFRKQVLSWGKWTLIAVALAIAFVIYSKSKKE